MIASTTSMRVGGWHVVDVTLESSVREYDHGPIASAVFSLAECDSFRGQLLTQACRGTSVDRLKCVLTNGIDVEPPNSPIWVGPIDKAMEYGGLSKLLLVLDPKRLDRSFREIEASDKRRTTLRQTFPTEIPSKDGSRVWLSRLAADDRRLGPGYEEAYGYWIPGDAKKALIAIIVIQHPDHDPVTDVADVVREVIRGSETA